MQHKYLSTSHLHGLSALVRGPYSVGRLLITCLVIGSFMLAAVHDVGAGRRGRFTATDLQAFNPSFLDSSASVEWVDANGTFQARLPIDLGPRASQYFTPELSGLVPNTFIGGVEVISQTGPVFATITHFDKGPGAPDFERGNEHYEIRGDDSVDMQLNAPVLIVSGSVRSNISILSSAQARPLTVTVEFHRADGVVATSIVTTVLGNALIDVSAVLSAIAPFSGTARLLSDQSILGYVSIYDGLTQKGYTLAPKPLPIFGTKSPETFTRSRLPNVQPTDDEFITRTLYVQNIDFFQADDVIIRSRFGTLFTGTIPAQGQIAYTLPYSKAITELFIDSNNHLEAVLLIDDANPADRDAITGSAAYVALSPLRDQALTQRAAVAADTHCAVAATVYGGYQGWQTSLHLVNMGAISGTAVITYFPALGASSTSTPVSVIRVLTPGVSVIPDYAPIADSNGAWSAYVEADVPFVGDVTSVHANIPDGIMAYRLEPTTCVSIPRAVFIPLALR